MTHKLVIVKKRDPERDPRVTFFLLFFRSLRLCSAQRILKSDWVNLTFAALRLTFIRGHEGFSKFHADRVIIGLPCGQGQLSRIWKVQRDWLSLGKECCLRFYVRVCLLKWQFSFPEHLSEDFCLLLPFLWPIRRYTLFLNDAFLPFRPVKFPPKKKNDN